MHRYEKDADEAAQRRAAANERQGRASQPHARKRIYSDTRVTRDAAPGSDVHGAQTRGRRRQLRLLQVAHARAHDRRQGVRTADVGHGVLRQTCFSEGVCKAYCPAEGGAGTGHTCKKQPQI